MIRSFRHKGLRALHQRGDTSGVRADHIARLRRLLASWMSPEAPNDMDRPRQPTASSQGKLDGFWSVAVSGNWRVIFRFDGSDVELVDYLDYH
ncbi:type II toxin-antitoxin system RelE/ParE family toxin [Klebsiella pneumoniae]|nr:type II toxin-antitoxin system RelE/ParE family toxin [Klebsiella pneumoniae]